MNFAVATALQQSSKVRYRIAAADMERCGCVKQESTLTKEAYDKGD